MNTESWKFAEQILPSTYIRQAADATKNRENLIRQLIQHKKIPVDGWDDYTIEIFLNQLSAMDSNNFLANCGVGEREGRFASALVARRNYSLAHGVGRSGDLTETQPKAAGSSLMAKLNNCMLKDLFSFTGIQDSVHCLLVPVATSMSLVLSMLTLRIKNPQGEYVIWSRIDQKACFKSIITSGLKPVIIDTILENDQLVTDIKSIENVIRELGANKILCIMSTTSCFAPRACDSIETIAKLCKDKNIPHLINNAYGLQSKIYMERIQKAHKKGRVDIFVQSTDKNFMVPVGGTIIAGFDKPLIDSISSTYPGRASSSPLIDIFITLLSLGRKGYEEYLKKREEMYKLLHKKLTAFSEKYGERVLLTPDNQISLGLTLSTIRSDHLTKVGSMLFIKNVSGARVVTTFDTKKIADNEFTGWGAHCKKYPMPYITCAASIGIIEKDIDLFIKRLDKVFTKVKRNEDLDSNTTTTNTTT